MLSAAEYSVQNVPNVQLRSRYNFVSNPDGILSREAVARIDSICYALRVSNIAQVAVVAVDQIVDDSGRKADPFTFAYNLFSEWGVGREGRDNGLGILFVGDQRQIRFVTGRGVEGVLPDAICKRIQTQYMLPYFRQGDFSAGMVSGVSVVESILVRSELNAGGSDYYPVAGDQSSRGLSLISILVILSIVIFLPMILSLVSYYRNARCAKCGRFGLMAQAERVVQRGDNFELVEHTFVCPHCGNRESRIARQLRDDLDSVIRGGVIIGGGYGASRRFRGGGFYGGGFGGGGGFSGGGFGGGSFGGGGAGSGW
ncbi:MAG: TPM domain-containing protein [Rikenellaceae bacterium]